MLGSNENGVFYYVCYGAKYTAFTPSLRHKAEKFMGIVMEYLTSKYAVCMIYIHTGTPPLRKGALSEFRRMYMPMPDENKRRIFKIYVVEPSKFLSARMRFFRTCILVGDTIFTKIEVFPTLNTFLDNFSKQEPLVARKLFSSLPFKFVEAFNMERFKSGRTESSGSFTKSIKS